MSTYDSWKWEQPLQLCMWLYKNSISEKILGLVVDNNVDFGGHISNIYKIEYKLKTEYFIQGVRSYEPCRYISMYELR